MPGTSSQEAGEPPGYRETQGWARAQEIPLSFELDGGLPGYRGDDDRSTLPGWELREGEWEVAGRTKEECAGESEDIRGSNPSKTKGAGTASGGQRREALS